MRRILLRLTFLLALGLAATPARSQSIGRAFSLFLDCRDLDCESDFYRQETAFVDHVRERTEADVHLLVTQQQTGSGGSVRLGLARYLARTPEGEQAALTLTSSELAIPPRATRDPWNAWVLQLEAQVELERERSSSATEFDLDFRADRITEHWKTRMRVGSRLPLPARPGKEPPQLRCG